MTIFIVGIIVFIIVVSITGFLWRFTKKLAVILIIVALICSLGANSYINSIKKKVILPLEKSITNVNKGTINVTQQKFKNSLGVLNKFASVDTSKNNNGKYTVKFKVFGIIIHEEEVNKK